MLLTYLCCDGIISSMPFFYIIIITDTAIVVLDTETTGTDPDSDRVIEAAFAAIKNGVDSGSMQTRSFQSKLFFVTVFITCLCCSLLTYKLLY